VDIKIKERKIGTLVTLNATVDPLARLELTAIKFAGVWTVFFEVELENKPGWIEESGMVATGIKDKEEAIKAMCEFAENAHEAVSAPKFSMKESPFPSDKLEEWTKFIRAVRRRPRDSVALTPKEAKIVAEACGRSARSCWICDMFVQKLRVDGNGYYLLPSALEDDGLVEHLRQIIGRDVDEEPISFKSYF